MGPGRRAIPFAFRPLPARTESQGRDSCATSWILAIRDAPLLSIGNTPPDDSAVAALLERYRRAGLRIVTAESCTGGLVAGRLTDIAGSSEVVERGFVTYSNESKTELLGVPVPMIAQYGAVSAQTARAMAEGALSHARADLAIAITGIAGPGGATPGKPVGLV